MKNEKKNRSGNIKCERKRIKSIEIESNETFRSYSFLTFEFPFLFVAKKKKKI